MQRMQFGTYRRRVCRSPPRLPSDRRASLCRRQLERVRATQQQAVKERLALERALAAAELTEAQLVELNDSLTGRVAQLEHELRVSDERLHELQARPAVNDCEWQTGRVGGRSARGREWVLSRRGLVCPDLR